MKVIGKTDDGLIVTMTKDELAQMAGYKWANRLAPGIPGITASGVIEVGLELPVSEMYKTAQEYIDTWKTVKAAVTTIKNAAGRMATACEDQE